MTEIKEIKRRLQFSFDYSPLCALIGDGVKYKEKLWLWKRECSLPLLLFLSFCTDQTRQWWMGKHSSTWQNILQTWSVTMSPSSCWTSCTPHYEQLESNDRQPCHPILQVPATRSKVQPEKKVNSLTKPKWKIKTSKNSHTLKESKPTLLQRETL